MKVSGPRYQSQVPGLKSRVSGFKSKRNTDLALAAQYRRFLKCFRLGSRTLDMGLWTLDFDL